MNFHSCILDIMSSCYLYVCHLVYDDQNLIATRVFISWQSLFHYFDDKWYLWYFIRRIDKIKIEIASNYSNSRTKKLSFYLSFSEFNAFLHWMQLEERLLLCYLSVFQFLKSQQKQRHAISSKYHHFVSSEMKVVIA